MSDDETMRQLIDDIEAVRGTLMDPSRAVAMERLAKRGTLSARTRIDRLLDRESFSEIGALVAAEESAAAPPPARTLSPADGVVVGTGLIDGRPVVVFSQDFAVFGGSIGRLGSAKIQRALQLAITRGLPLVMILDGGGHRIQDGQDARHFANANATFHNFARASGWAPMVEAGQLRLLAVFTRDRAKRFPAVPAVHELGIPVVVDSPGGLIGPRGMDPATVAALADAFRAAALEPEHLKFLESMDMPLILLDGPAYKAEMAKTLEEEREVLRRLNLLPA